MDDSVTYDFLKYNLVIVVGNGYMFTLMISQTLREELLLLEFLPPAGLFFTEADITIHLKKQYVHQQKKLLICPL